MHRAIYIPIRALCLILVNFLFFSGPAVALATDMIRINGSGSGMEMLQPLMESYGKEVRGVSFIREKPLGSSGAIKALLAGAIHIAVTSRPLKPEEITQGAKLKFYGKTPLAIITEKKNPLKNITSKELEDIYSGITKTWPNGETIRIVLRPEEDIDTKTLKGLSPAMAEAVDKAQHRPGMMIAVTDPESNEAVAKTIGALGASGLTGIVVGRLPLNVLALNGVMPNRQNLASETYPLAKELNFVVTGNLAQSSVKFLDFVYSNRGRAIAEKTGVLITGQDK